METAFGYLCGYSVYSPFGQPAPSRGIERARKKSRGIKDQLLIDKTILKEMKRLKKNVVMSWIDYKKTYDMVPHSWIKETLNITEVAKKHSTSSNK